MSSHVARSGLCLLLWSCSVEHRAYLIFDPTVNRWAKLKISYVPYGKFFFPFWNYHSLGTVLIYCNKNLLCCGSVCCLPSVSSSRYHWVAGLYPAYTDIPYYFICTSWSNCSVYLFLYCPSWCIGEFQYCHLICSWSHYQYYLSLSFYLSLICIWSLGYYFRSHYPYFLWSGNRWCICWGLISELVIWKPTQLVFRTQLSQPCYAYLFYLVK